MRDIRLQADSGPPFLPRTGEGYRDFPRVSREGLQQRVPEWILDSAEESSRLLHRRESRPMTDSSPSGLRSIKR